VCTYGCSRHLLWSGCSTGPRSSRGPSGLPPAQSVDERPEPVWTFGIYNQTASLTSKPEAGMPNIALLRRGCGFRLSSAMGFTTTWSELISGKISTHKPGEVGSANGRANRDFRNTPPVRMLRSRRRRSGFFFLPCGRWRIIRFGLSCVPFFHPTHRRC
jgi:hypothetical protein